MAKRNRRLYIIKMRCGSMTRVVRRLSFLYANLNVSLTVYQNGFCAKYSQKTRPSAASFDQRKLEIVKKSILLGLIETGKSRRFYDVKLSIDGECLNGNRFFCLETINECLLKKEEKEKLENIVISNNRANYPISVTCFINYFLGRCTTVADAFRYLFQAFNSFYSNIETNGISPVGKKENEKLELLCKGFYLESKIWVPSKDERASLCSKLDFTNKSVALKELNRRIARLEAKDGKGPINNCDAFIVLCYSYYLRCKYFHGEASLPIVSSIGDVELNGLKACNQALSDFLEKHIGLLIEQDYNKLIKQQ